MGSKNRTKKESKATTDKEEGFIFRKTRFASKCNKQTNQVVEKENIGGEVTIKKCDCYYSSNFNTSIKELKLLRYGEEQIRHVKMTPFWFLFNALYRCEPDRLKGRCQKNEDILRKIILCFDDSKHSFIIGGSAMKLTNMDVNLILGVCGGEQYIPYKTKEYQLPNWVKQCFRSELLGDKGRVFLYKTMIYSKLKERLSVKDEDSLIDAARLTHCYLLAVLLAPNQNTSISPHLTQYFEIFEEVCTFDYFVSTCILR